MTESPAERRRDVIVAGHRGQIDLVLAALDDDAPEIRVAAVGAAGLVGAALVLAPRLVNLL